MKMTICKIIFQFIPLGITQYDPLRIYILTAENGPPWPASAKKGKKSQLLTFTFI